MNPRPGNNSDRDAILQQLAHLDSSDPADPTRLPEPPSTVRELKAQLDTLIAELREPAGPDPFADESGLRRAQELVRGIGAEPGSMARDKRVELGRIGPYELLEKLGEGGMGAVYKALHSSLEKIVALKILPRDRLHPHAISRFKREMKAVGKLDHPNIVRATDAGEADGDHFLVMEYVDGVDLSELLRRVGPLASADACELIRQATIGLQHAHQRGLVHRDIKPNNLMLSWGVDHEPAVKILDMGLALLSEPMAAAQGDLTTTGQMMGTVEYMSPEQGLDTHSVDIRSDIYSLGATLYKLLCGTAPFSGARYNTPGKIMVALATEKPASIRAQRADLPTGLVTVVDRMLAKDPAERYATPAEVAQALAPFASGADLRRLADAARHHGTQADVATDKSKTPTKEHLSSPITGTVSEEKWEGEAPAEPQTVGQDGSAGASPSRNPTCRMDVGANVLNAPRAREAQQFQSAPAVLSRLTTPRRRRVAILSAVGLLALIGVGILLGGQIVRIVTNQGQIVIETDGAGIEVVIKDGEGNVLDTETKREITFKAGEYNIEVTVKDSGGEQRFVTDQFTLTRGGKHVVKARWKVAQAKPTAESSDADRRAAEWVLSVGGNMSIKENGKEREIKAVGDLPRGAFEVTVVILETNPKVSDAGLAHFKDCKNLTVLNLAHTKVSDAGLAHFRDCTNLTVLNLLGGTQVSDAGLAHFRDCTNLTVLNLGGTQVSDAGLAHFKDCKNLTHVTLAGTRVSDAGLAFFQDCKNLASLDLGGIQVSDAGLAHLRDCQNLAALYLNGTQVSDAGLALFKDCKNLTRLALGGTQVRDAGLAHFQDCENLEYLYLHRTQISDAALTNLAGLPSLIQLALDDTRISLRGHEQLKAAMPKCLITWSEMNRTVAESVLALGGLVEIGIPGQPESRPVKVLADLPGGYFQVRRVSLAGVAKPLDTLPERLSWLRFPEFDRLERVDLSGLTGLTYASLAPIHGLQELSLANGGLNDASLGKLPKLLALKRLVLDGNDIRGIGFAALKEQPELIDLSLGCPSLNDLLARKLAELKQLKRLSLAGSGLTDAGIKRLAGLTNLEFLDLRRTKATATGVAELQKALPKCRIEWDGTKEK